MEGKRKSAQHRNELLSRIRDFTLSIVQDLCHGQPLVVPVKKFSNYCTDSLGNCFCHSDLPKGKELLTLTRPCHAQRLNALLRVLLIVQQLLQENRHASKRDVYYMHPTIFPEQSTVDRAINDICILLECSRHHLNLVSVGNGYVKKTAFIYPGEDSTYYNVYKLLMGWIKLYEDEARIDCISSPNTAHSIPVLVEEVKDICCSAQYILVVEKESVFQRLANDRFCSKNRCIVVTGRGYPDVSTRRFLRLLVDRLNIPVYCLMDSDPYGFDILMTYRFGSMQMAYDARFLRIPEISWLGTFISDSESFAIPPQCLLPLTNEDKKRTEALLRRCYLQKEKPEWRSELELMLHRGVKFEIEALSANSLSFLSEEYLPSKIAGKVYL